MAKDNIAGLPRGISAVANALKGEDFPTDKQNLYYSVGDIEIECGNGKFIPTRVALDRVDAREFVTLEDAVAAIKSGASAVRRNAA